MTNARMPRTMLVGMVAAGTAGAVWLTRRMAGRGAPGMIADERRDEVDEAIDESFPASDPPSFAGSRGGR